MGEQYQIGRCAGIALNLPRQLDDLLVVSNGDGLTWKGPMMSWLILVVSGMFETVWASALSRMAEKFQWLDLLFFIGGSIVSLGGLMIAMKEIPVGTAYAAWAGTGAVVTVVWSIISGSESASLIKIVLVAVLIGCIVGLHLIDASH